MSPISLSSFFLHLGENVRAKNSLRDCVTGYFKSKFRGITVAPYFDSFVY